MGTVLLPDVSGIQNFDISDSTGLSARWKRWLRAFQLFAAGKGVTDVDQKYALLLHTAGMNVQDIFFTLPEGAGEGAYEKAVSALDAYFTPLSNAPYERSIFRSMIQSSSETIEQYITRLRQRADSCDFGNQNAIDERIRDQIIDKCLSHHLRRKLLEKGKTLTLANVRSIAKAMEDSERQAKSIEGQGQVNMIQSKGKQYGKNSFNSGNKSFNLGNKSTCTATCYRCGRKGQALLSRNTAEQLGVLQLVHSVSEPGTIKDKYPECFTGVGKLKSFQLQIPIDPDVEPVIQPMRRVPFNLRDKLAKKLDELLDLDIIEHVNEPSQWVSPVVVVPKRSGDDIRLCVDMRQSNTAVKRVRHPIPTIDELLQEMNSSKVFSKLDVTWAYHQIELKPESREITTFVTHKGLFRYKRLMFGISCAPELYKNIMQQVLQGCEGVHNIMDDIIVHASNQVEHNKCLENVVRVLQDKGITLNNDKCEFNMSKVVFMGHVLSGRGIGPADVKVKAVVEAREPRTSAEVRSFLGLVNYSARFISDLATISAPLRALTRKDATFTWGKDEQRSFDELKRRLANAETLGYYEKSALTKVIADDSPVGLGAVLIQEQNGELRIISYASRSLSDTERRYSQTEKEALALVWACERFHVYIYGSQFELLTDHKPLECIYSTKSKVCARIERWVLRKQPHTYTVRYIPGPKNIADSLSRLIKEGKTSDNRENVTEEYVKFVAQNQHQLR
ncbi:unnamed protein product [Mytilus coruscus]|uniref:Reverse transcriptase domain-containing protein n=1 Tax=Mytilus coruscus TaxID=42192 RepID=A0A6J8CML9_MYTCO|nr:unnamed protein product [Mytilus coruscus]